MRIARLLGRLLLAAILLIAGVAHLVDTSEFLGQLPGWAPWRDAIVIVSGLMEITMGVALLATRERRLAQVGLVIAVFFVLVFPGNLTQYVVGSDSFGLDTDTKRLVRLPFQVPLIALALWSTSAWALLRSRRGATSAS